MPIRTKVIFECDAFVPGPSVLTGSVACGNVQAGWLLTKPLGTEYVLPSGWQVEHGNFICTDCAARSVERKLLESRVPLPDPRKDPPSLQRAAAKIKEQMKLVVADEQAYEHEVARSMDGLSDENRRRIHEFQDKHLEEYRDDPETDPTTH